MNYYDYVTRVMQESGTLNTDTPLATVVPAMIEYAEQRLYRELDLLGTRYTDASTQFSSGNRNFSLPSSGGTFLVIEDINVISPAGAASTASSAVRTPMMPVDRSYVDAVYNDNSQTSAPSYYARVNSSAIVVGPIPDGAYYAEVIGTIRPTALSSANTTTILTTLLPALFVVASMLYLAQRANDPTQVQKWEAEYQKLFGSANIEELRKRYMSNAWTSLTPSPVATPQRV